MLFLFCFWSWACRHQSSGTVKGRIKTIKWCLRLPLRPKWHITWNICITWIICHFCPKPDPPSFSVHGQGSTGLTKADNTVQPERWQMGRPASVTNELCPIGPRLPYLSVSTLHEILFSIKLYTSVLLFIPLCKDALLTIDCFISLLSKHWLNISYVQSTFWNPREPRIIRLKSCIWGHNWKIKFIYK